MIEIVATLYPCGDRSNPKELGRGVLINDGTGTVNRGHYDVRFCGQQGRIKRGKVVDFPRLSLGVWHLLARALKEARIK